MEASTKHKICGTLSFLGGIAALAHAKDASSTGGTVAISAAGGVLTLAGLSHLHRGFMGDGGQTGTVDGLALAGLALAGEGCNCGDLSADGMFGALEEDVSNEGNESHVKTMKAVFEKINALKAECPAEWQNIWDNWMDRAYNYASKDWENRKAIKGTESDRVKSISRKFRAENDDPNERSLGVKKVAAFLSSQGVKGPRVKRIIDELISLATMRYRMVYSTFRIKELRIKKDAKNKDARKKQIQTRLSVLAKFEAGARKLLKRNLESLSGLEMNDFGAVALSGDYGAVALSGDYGAVALSGDYGADDDEESEAEEQFDRAKDAIERTSDAFTKLYWNWMERAKKDGERYAQKLRLDDPDYDPNAYWKEMSVVVKVVAADRLAIFLTARGVNPLGREGQEIMGRLREVGERRFVSAYWAERASRLRKAGKSKYADRIRFAKDKRLANLRGWAKGTEDLVRALKQAVKD